MKDLLACLSLLLMILLATACEPDQVNPAPEPEPLNPERVNFQEPVVGQFNTFEVLSYGCGEELPDENRTLTLTVTAVSPTEIEFTEESPDQPTPYVYTAERVPGNLLISAEERVSSQLFYFYGSDSIRLDAEPVAQVRYEDCIFYNGTEPFTGDYVASIRSFELAGREMRNLKSVSCVPVILDLDGYLLYDEHSLRASMATSGSAFGGDTSAFTTVYLLMEEVGQ